MELLFKKKSYNVCSSKTKCTISSKDEKDTFSFEYQRLNELKLQKKDNALFSIQEGILELKNEPFTTHFSYDEEDKKIVLKVKMLDLYYYEEIPLITFATEMLHANVDAKKKKTLDQLPCVSEAIDKILKLVKIRLLEEKNNTRDLQIGKFILKDYNKNIIAVCEFCDKNTFYAISKSPIEQFSDIVMAFNRFEILNVRIELIERINPFFSKYRFTFQPDDFLDSAKCTTHYITEKLASFMIDQLSLIDIKPEANYDFIISAFNIHGLKMASSFMNDFLTF